MKPEFGRDAAKLSVFDPSDNQEGGSQHIDYRSDLWSHLKRIKAESFSQSAKSLKRKAERDIVMASFKNMAIGGYVKKEGIPELSDMVKKLKLQEGKKTCPKISSRESSPSMCSDTRSAAVSSQLVGQSLKELEVNGNGEKVSQNVLECSESSSAHSPDAALSDLQSCWSLPPISPLILKKNCDWLEQNDQ